MRRENSKLTVKQQLFVEAYLGKARGNATEAARLAGYAGNDKTLSVVGAENLAKPCIAAAVAPRLEKAKKCLQADEVLELLTDHATATMDDFFDVIEVKAVAMKRKDPAACDDPDSPAEDLEPVEPPMRQTYPVLNIGKAKERGKMHLVKKISYNQFGPVLELYSSQSALELLGRHWRLFTDKTELSGAGGGPIEMATPEGKRQAAIARMLEKALSTGISEEEARASLLEMGVEEYDLPPVSSHR